MTDSNSAVKNARNLQTMLKRNAALTAQGYRHSVIAFSPLSLDIIEQIKARFDVTSREAAVNKALELLAHEVLSKQEQSAVTT